MALKIALKPRERLIVGRAVIINGSSKAELVIENAVPVLREPDILSIENADSPCKRIYFVIQLMYVDEKNAVVHQKSYWTLVHELLDAAPSATGLVDRVSTEILAGRFYQALKAAKKLIAHEAEVMKNVRRKA